MKRVIRGKVYKCGDNVTAYQIIAQNRWALGLNAQELGKWAMEGACPEVCNVENGFRQKGCTIVAGGEDFGGGGKSIEHPIAALQGAGVELLIADSFSRYSFRNAINRGLPAILCPGITDIVHTGDELEADLITGRIRNCTTGAEIQGAPLSDLVLEFVECGGMLAYYRGKEQPGG
ncbi:MAG: 3-isopropylmalate dehydratase [Gemmiger sp.]